jgi:hypothetical protein
MLWYPSKLLIYQLKSIVATLNPVTLSLLTNIVDRKVHPTSQLSHQV